MSGRCGGPRPSDDSLFPYTELQVQDGLELRQIVLDDAAELFATVDANRKNLREWLAWLDGTNSLEDEISFIASTLEEYVRGEGVLYGIRLDGDLVGTISLNWIDWGNRGCGVGYWLAEDQTGNGYVTKSCVRLMEHCFDDLKLHRFVLEAATENFPSRAIAENLGMRLEGITKDREWLYDHYVDGALYAITAPEWHARNQG
ncbi:MAG: GNAT family protein [Candidatus Thermoplasmatota archaeon]|nr:GNAT family protein [Candidatus Thermoplasmatota archaeon]